MYEEILIGIAAIAVVGLIGNGLVAWRQQGILKNDVEHLKGADTRIENAIEEVRKDVQWLVKYVRRAGLALSQQSFYGANRLFNYLARNGRVSHKLSHWLLTM